MEMYEVMCFSKVFCINLTRNKCLKSLFQLFLPTRSVRYILIVSVRFGVPPSSSYSVENGRKKTNKQKTTKSKENVIPAKYLAMGVMVRVLIAGLCLGLAALYQNYRLLKQPIPAPKLDEKQYWGPGSGADYKEDVSIKPFDIAAKPEVSLRVVLAVLE